ncbi:hypothetical protein OPT61_g5732 [Boeremia exigua]|uniref:Uncharacterized protein n=1 Tax=Boeremia exigua TaxID=749465 RepID=A0ACC2I9A6_9PLEO|nr:hypothetical protein OPT61_g5732 [Boeremia exigua]
MPAQPNGPPHMRRESSQSSNQGFQPNGGRGRGFQPQPYNQSPQPYRAMPNQPMGGRGMPPAFTPQGLQNSPYRNQRPSPAMAPAQMHQQQHFANPQGPSFYPGQQYPQPVRIPSHISNISVSASSKAIKSPAAILFSQSPSSPQVRSANLTALAFQAPDDESNAFIQSLDFSSFAAQDREQYLTTVQQQNMYAIPPQGLDPYNNYYGQPGYGLQQSIHYPGVPNSPGRGHGFPQQMQNPYSMPGPYGQPPQGQSMSRTPSQMSERPPSAVPQPSTPAMTNVSHHAHTPSVTSASPAPSSTAFERPKKKSAAIVIKNADGEVVDFKSKGAASPAPNAAPSAPAQSKSPAIAATPTPPPRAPSASDATRAEEPPVKSASEKKADFVKQFQEKLRLQEEADKKAKDDADNAAKAAADAEQKKKDDAKAAEEKAAQEAKAKEEAAAKEAQEAKEAEEKAAKEAKEKEEADAAAAAAAAAAKSSEEDAAEKKRKEDEDFERMIAEMEAEEAKREADEKKFQEEKKRKQAEEAAKAGDKIKEQEEAMRKAEREAEAAEIARQNETPEQKAEREAKDKEMFASLKKNTMFGPGATGEEPSEDAAPPAAAPAPAAKPASATKPKPAALKLETNKPVEPAQPTAGMESLKTARFLQIRNEAINYPEGIQSPNPALNQGSKSKGRQYDKDFLLQFQEVFKEKPSVDWDLKLKETVGDGSDSARTPSVRGTAGRAPSGRSGLGGAGGMGNFGQGSAFGGSRTLPPGTTSEQRFQQASGRGPGTMTNPLAPFVQGGSQRGGFPMAPGMARSSSFQPGPNSPRVGSQGGRGDRSRRGGGNKDRQADAKTMPLTAGKEIKGLEQSTTGWKPHGSEKQVAVGHMAPDMVQRKVKAALNKMTPEKFDKISDQILEIAAQSKDETDGRTLRQVIQLTFEKACDEAHWSSMYAKFCYKMLNTMSHDIKDENVRDKTGNPVVGGALFRKYLLNRCQEEFERGWEVNLPEAPEEGKEATMLSDEYYIAAAAKRKGLGLIQFIGELYKLGMLTLRIMHECVLKLLDFEGLPDESAIESLVKLLRTVGATMESAEAGPKMINMYFERVEKVMNMEGLNSRLRFMLLDTIDLRKSGWQSKDTLKGPKTIAEIHQEAVAAQQAAEMERSRSQRGGGEGEYTSGRWLWGEEAQQRARHRAFNVPSLQKLAARIARSEKCVSMRKIGEGNFNKVFRLQMDNGAVLMARIPHPNAGSPEFTTASEVATMDFAKSVLDIPVPRVLGYCATPDNPVGAEYIIMEEAQGTQLLGVWDTMDLKDQVGIVNELVKLDGKLLSASLNRHGALYYRKDGFPGRVAAEVTGDIAESLKADVANRFVVGPTVERAFWEKERAVMDVDRGPCTAREYVYAIAHREIAWLSHYAESSPPSMEKWGASHGQRDRQAHIDLLGKYLSVVAQLLPKEPELLAPSLWHRDLHPGNLFIHDGKISSVIDWQSCWAGPLILRARTPRLLDYSGEMMLKLPPLYEAMPDDERRAVKSKVQQSLQVYSYERETAVRNPRLNQVRRYPHGKMLGHVVDFAGAAWDDDILPLRDCLIRIERDWKEYTGSTAPCPYHFSAEEIQQSHEDAVSYNDMRDFWDEMRGRVDESGFTTPEFFDEAVEIFAALREVGWRRWKARSGSGLRSRHGGCLRVERNNRLLDDLLIAASALAHAIYLLQYSGTSEISSLHLGSSSHVFASSCNEAFRLNSLLAIILPAMMVTQVAMSIWLIGVKLPLSLMRKSHVKRPAYHTSESHHTAAAIAIIVGLALSLALWLLPLTYCLWSSRFVAQFRYTADDAPDCIQVQDVFGHARYRDICHLFQQDRMYHGEVIGKCLPLLDHHCLWWSGSVWRDNKKPYLLFLLFLPLHLLFCLALAIWIMRDPRFRDEDPYIRSFLVDGAFVLLALWLAFAFWSRIALMNVSTKEVEEKTIWYKSPTCTIVAWNITPYNASESPWYMGSSENFRLTMGRKRDLLLFWKPTPMATADSLPTRKPANDPREGIQLPELSSASRSRRSAVQSSSTGFEAELSRWDASVRQRRATDNT